jgi:hypothetical protein
MLAGLSENRRGAFYTLGSCGALVRRPVNHGLVIHERDAFEVHISRNGRSAGADPIKAERPRWASTGAYARALIAT